MKEKLKNEILVLLDSYGIADIRRVENDLELILSKYDIFEQSTDVVIYENYLPETVKMYIVSKKIAGLSIKTLYLYTMVLNDFFKTLRKPNDKITASDIKVYLFAYQQNNNISNRTLDCRRTIICSYFEWLTAEDYIQKNPAANISPIKYEKKHKVAMTQLELEKVRLACQTKREKAIVEMLYSTGCRVSELENLNKSDVNFQTKEVLLFGKGSKHRTSYINAKAEIALREYLNSRSDINEALFVYDKAPYDRLKKSGIEAIIKKIVSRIDGGTNTHITPHIFRHTMASTSLEHGMNVVEVSKLLGHSRIETTMEYITMNTDSIKNNHTKYLT